MNPRLAYAAFMLAGLAVFLFARRVLPKSPDGLASLTPMERLAIGLAAFAGGTLGARLPFVISVSSEGLSFYQWLGDGKTIDVSDLPPAIRAEPAEPGSAGVPAASSLSTTALAEMERMTILRVFEQAHGDKALAGKMLGISRATLYRKLKRYNIAVKGSEEGGEAESPPPS